MQWHLTIVRTTTAQVDEFVFHGAAENATEAAVSARYAREQLPGREYKIMVRNPLGQIEHF